MSPNYPRPPSTPTGRLKVEYDTYDSPQRAARPQSSASPPQNGGVQYPTRPQQHPGYYYQQEPFPPPREDGSMGASGHQGATARNTAGQNGDLVVLPALEGNIPGTGPARSGGGIKNHDLLPTAGHISRGHEAPENEFRARGHQQDHSTGNMALYRGPLPLGRDSTPWMAPPAGARGVIPGPVHGQQVQYATGGMPAYYPAPHGYVGYHGQSPASQSWPVGYNPNVQRQPERYYPIAQQPQRWVRPEGGEGDREPHYASYYRPGAAVQGQVARPRNTNKNPLLVRTSAINQACSSWNFNGRGGRPGYRQAREQARLDIEGKLMEVTKNWDVDEDSSCRRLIMFERMQEGAQVRLKFRIIPQEEYDQETTVVSCILWKELDEHYVTSVDCINLLELIINEKFSVEEKNRVRRNLEVCKPKTISKSKKDLKSFFKLIMKFESPRPRNIEKDVKVFPWTMLENALQKIVSKYSACYFNDDFA